MRAYTITATTVTGRVNTASRFTMEAAIVLAEALGKHAGVVRVQVIDWMGNVVALPVATAR